MQNIYKTETIIPEAIIEDASSITIDTTTTIQPNFLHISGTAKASIILGLWHNDRYVSSEIVRAGKYSFPLQALKTGNNRFIIWSMHEDGRTTLVDSFYVHFHSARLNITDKPLSQLNTHKKILSLTFDAGSISTGADSILQILLQKNVQTTFFLTGAFIQRYPEIVQMVVQNGHEVANHTFSHPHLTQLEQNNTQNTRSDIDQIFVQTQLIKTDSIFYATSGQHLSAFWRAPFGEYNKQILEWAADVGYRHIGWSPQCDTFDWVSDTSSKLYRSTEEIFQYLMELERKGKLNGAIILMHFGTDRRNDFPYLILPKLIDELRFKNYQIVTISQLISSEITV